MAITISGDSPNFSAATVTTLTSTTGTVTTLTAPTSTITTLNAPSGVLATQNGMTGIVKAWAVFNASGTIYGGAGTGSYNVSSITVGAGVSFTVNFTTALPSVNYSVSGSASDDGTSVPAFGESGSTLANRTTTSVKIILAGGVTRTCISIMVCSN